MPEISAGTQARIDDLEAENAALRQKVERMREALKDARSTVWSIMNSRVGIIGEMGEVYHPQLTKSNVVALEKKLTAAIGEVEANDEWWIPKDSTDE